MAIVPESNKVIDRALAFYKQSPTGQYDDEAVEALELVKRVLSEDRATADYVVEYYEQLDLRNIFFKKV